MDFTQILITAAKSVKISSVILVAVCTHETGLNNVVVPHDGGSASIGICQVKYETAHMLGYEGNPKGLLNPKINARYAALYLKYQYDRYNNWCKTIAAFNAGRFNESRREPGHPRNLKYVLNVRKKLSKHFQNMITCDNLDPGDENVAQNNGP
jgi:hypothetical protein